MDDLGDNEAPPPATPAATVVVFRRDPQGGPAQILLVERSSTMNFAGGATVFPGGKIDPGDYELAERFGAGLDPEDAAARIAAVREALEETGLAVGISGEVNGEIAAEARRVILSTGRLEDALSRFGWALDLDRLVPFARWWPRHRHIRVFDTRFYLADLGTGAVDIAVDATENRHLFWASAAEALRLADEGAIKVIFPTRRNLERLACYPDFESCRAHALETPVTTISPRVELRDGVQWLTIPKEAGYPYDGEPLDTASRA
ncbi:NUDIX domain-containing protein [Novosphingobium sp. KCTC 2891]|nr:NUDIX domain-containing protein [Novosphingobium sp. KCTC 2891]MCW1381362.1 NUDIX domain-containing protein [Novosphingobium sp. KCTC 2891]